MTRSYVMFDRSEVVELAHVVAENRLTDIVGLSLEHLVEELLRVWPRARLVREVVAPHHRFGADDLLAQDGRAISHEGHADVLAEVVAWFVLGTRASQHAVNTAPAVVLRLHQVR